MLKETYLIGLSSLAILFICMCYGIFPWWVMLLIIASHIRITYTA